MSFFTPPPPTPVGTDPATFRTRAINAWAWLYGTLLNEFDALYSLFTAAVAAMNTNDTRDTSTSSVLIGVGTKVFTVSAGKSFSAGQWLTLSNTPAPTNQMIGNVASYSGTTLTVNVPANGVFGSGTLAAWTIALTAAPSAQIAATFLPVSSAANLPASRTALEVSSTTEMNTAIAAAVPAGATMPFARNTAPTGWLKANGALISRTTYAALFAAIGTTFGVGDGSTTFAVPDMRGEFLRGWDDGRGIDSSRVFGSAQADDFKSHTHTKQYEPGASAANLAPTLNTYFNSATGVTGATGGTETRPRNIAMLVCIKY